MARKKLKQPSDFKTSNERKKIKERPHFDFDCDVFAEEHYGTYLIVKNSSKQDKSRKHNRLYLDTKKELEFLLKTGYGSQGLTRENHRSGRAHLFSIYPTHKTLIYTLISKVKRNEKRSKVSYILCGINTMIRLFEESKISIPEDPRKFSANIHQKCLFNAILEGKITVKSRLRNLGNAWFYIRITFDNSALGILPCQLSAEIQIKQMALQENEVDEELVENEGKDEITLEILFQLDYYSQIELDRIIKRRKEYQKWMRELNAHGELFSRANLLKTYYRNSQSRTLRNLYILLYKEDPRCWNPYKVHKTFIKGKRKFTKWYDSDAEKIRHQELIFIAETGIDISIENEKMLAWWHKTLFPKWPFLKKVTEPYNIVVKNIDVWLTKQAKIAGILLMDFHERIIPNINTLYPMYLRLLIDTTANTDTVSNIEVYKKADATYDMGVVHHNLRMLNSVKTRTNTVTPSFIAKGTFTDQCINFFIEWLTSVYERSCSDKFLQYVSFGGKIFQMDSRKVKELDPKKKNNSRKQSFFERYEIYQSFEKIINTKEKSKERVWKKERVWWIKHRNIRSANNFKNYHLLYGEWVRARVVMGQQDDQTEKQNYRKYAWKLGEEHQTALSLLHIQKFIEGKVIDEQLENAFEQPHCSCEDNRNPTFEGAPKINDDEVCTSWRYCLTRCDNSYVFPKHHGPTNMAWKIVMEQELDQFIRTEDWAKEYGEDCEAAEAVIMSLKPEDKEFAKSKAIELIPFVRLMMLQTKQKSKVNLTRKEIVNG